MPIFTRFAYASGVDIPTLLLLRFSMAAAILWVVLKVKGVRLPGPKGLVICIVMGALGYAGQAFAYFTALTFASASLVALMLYTYPVIVTLLSRIVLKHPLTGRQIMAVGIALVGGALIVGGALDGQPLGIIFGLLAAFLYSVYIVTGSQFPPDVTPVASTTVIATSAAATYGLVAAFRGLQPPSTTQGWLAVVAIAILCTVLAILFFFEGLERVGPVKASVFSTVEPLFTILLAAVVLDERITLLRVAGGSLILGAVLMLARESALKEAKSD
jgi:drug/metabolite transporter (DMT)-like permease